jgi:hypothetical protein
MMTINLTVLSLVLWDRGKYRQATGVGMTVGGWRNKYATSALVLRSTCSTS